LFSRVFLSIDNNHHQICRAGLATSRCKNMAGRKTVDHRGIPEGVGENCAMNSASESDNAVAQAILSQ
jgi:hypothetical protein